MNARFPEQTTVLEHTGLVVVRATGADAAGFLNNQLSNDLEALGPGHWQLDGYCSPKGRLIAVARVFRSGQEVYLLVAAPVAEPLLKRLQVFVFRAKVRFEILPHRVIAVTGKNAGRVCSQYATAVPAAGKVAEHRDGFVLNVSGINERFLFVSPDLPGIMDVQRTSGEESEQRWRLTEILEGMVTVYPQTMEKFIPQHVNLDTLGGISFTKGCFPGQEVVARLHYLGKSKQTMHRLELPGKTVPAPGETIEHADTGARLTIVDAVSTGHDRYTCLAVGKFG